MNTHLQETKNFLTETIQKETTAIKELEQSIDLQTLTSVLDAMERTVGRIIVTGMGKSGIIAQKIVSSLSSTGTTASFLHPAEASHGDLGMISQKDLVIAISNSGESKELADVINYCKRFHITLVGITKNPQSTLAKNVDFVLRLPQSPEADPLGLAPTSSTTVTLVLGDILTVALMTRKRFTAQDFQLRHPGGKLGAILQTVAQLMHTGKDIPLLPEEALFEKIIVEMSEKRLGCVGFINKAGELTGILTDGDLRRNMAPSLFEKTGKQIMHKDPKHVPPTMLASEALYLMNSKKITTLFITENNKPIGIVHIHDLLKAGVK